MPRFGRRHLLLAPMAGAVLSRASLAQGAGPLAGRTISLVVPYPAGGPTDILARMIATGLSERLGGTFVTQNVPGASTTTGARQVARARGDGSVLFLGTVTTFATAPHSFRNIGYNPVADFTPITLLADALNVLAAHPRWTSLAQVLEESRKRPGAITYAVQGIGTSGHLPMVDLAGRAGVEWLVVPYNGFPPALTDTVAGRTDMMFSQFSAAKGHLDGGRLRALGVASLERVPLVPGVPTIAEQGFPGFEAGGWYALSAPAGMPADLASTISAATNAILDTPAMRDFFANQGFVRMAAGPEALRARIVADLQLFRDLMRRAGVVPE